MRFSCTRDNFEDALGALGGIVTKAVHLPILQNVLIKAEGQGVELSATNLELALTIYVRAIVEEPGSFTVPARTLQEVAQLFSGDKISLEQQGGELVVQSGRTTTKIKGAPAEEFPIIPTVDTGVGLVIEAEKLKNGLSQVLYAAAKNDIRPELSGILWQTKKDGSDIQLVLAATDSYRLAEKTITVVQGEENTRVIVPGRTSQEIQRLLSLANSSAEERQARFVVGENQLVMRFGNFQLLSRLVSGNYPNYGQIIPQEFNTTFSFAIPAFSKEIKAAGLFTTTGVNAVTLALEPGKNQVVVTSAAAQTGEYLSEFEAEVEGKECSILLNHRYLLDGLNNLPGSAAQLKVVGPENPCLLVSPDDKTFQYVIMPIRQ